MKNTFLPDQLNDKLYCSEQQSTQPSALIRMALFTPVGQKKKQTREKTDITKPFRQIEYFAKEGFDMATIEGAPLNIQVDFKIWCGIVLAFSKYGLNSNKIELPFTEFAAMCGYNTRRFNKKLRLQVEKSLDRIQGQKIRLRKKDASKFSASGLLLKADYDIEGDDKVVLLGDENLWEIYSLDHQILVSLNILNELPRAEVAQCLYIYFTSLPADPLPISYERMRKRLNMPLPDKEVNRLIRTAIVKLEKLGYLTGLWVKFHNEKAYKITSRNKMLATKV